MFTFSGLSSRIILLTQPATSMVSICLRDSTFIMRRPRLQAMLVLSGPMPAGSTPTIRPQPKSSSIRCFRALTTSAGGMKLSWSSWTLPQAGILDPTARADAVTFGLADEDPVAQQTAVHQINRFMGRDLTHGLAAGW